MKSCACKRPGSVIGSPERREVERHGWEVAEDAMKVLL